MPMILELTEPHVMQEYHDKGVLQGPTFLRQGIRGIVKEAGYSAGWAGIDNGAEIVVIQIINEGAEFELVVVPLSKVRIVYDRAVKHERTPSSIPG